MSTSFCNIKGAFALIFSLSGYFVLGGHNPPPVLKTFDLEHAGNLIGSRDRGHWQLETTLLKLNSLSIPSRDKTVHLWGSSSDLSSYVQDIDSKMPGSSYLSKLDALIPKHVSGVIVNSARDTHGSLALMVRGQPLHMYGLYDINLKSSYLLWSTGIERIQLLLNSDPLRFNIYRFPVSSDLCIFIQAEAVCSKWFRWIKTSQSILHAFNALEHRLYGSS